MGTYIESFIKRSMHVSTRGALPDKLVLGYLYFVEDEGVILLRMEGDEVHTYAKQGPRGPQGPAGPGYYSPPPAPPPNPPAPPSGEFPVGTMLQFNSLPYKVPDGGTWEVDVVCTLSRPINEHFTSRLYNVRYKQTLSGGDTLTLRKLIEGADESFDLKFQKKRTLPKAALIADIAYLSISFVETTWHMESNEGNHSGGRHVPDYTARPGKATRKS